MARAPRTRLSSAATGNTRPIQPLRSTIRTQIHRPKTHPLKTNHPNSDLFRFIAESSAVARRIQDAGPDPDHRRDTEYHAGIDFAPASAPQPVAITKSVRA